MTCKIWFSAIENYAKIGTLSQQVGTIIRMTGENKNVVAYYYYCYAFLWKFLEPAPQSLPNFPSDHAWRGEDVIVTNVTRFI